MPWRSYRKGEGDRVARWGIRLRVRVPNTRTRTSSKDLEPEQHTHNDEQHGTGLVKDHSRDDLKDGLPEDHSQQRYEA